MHSIYVVFTRDPWACAVMLHSHNERTSTYLGCGAALATTLRVSILLNTLLRQAPFSKGIQALCSWQAV